MFTKGQRVNLVQSWNGKGEVSIYPAIVYSYGKKQMILTHAETGKELGRQFRPQREGWSGELVLTADEDAQTIAMEMATAIREKFIAYETKLIAEANGSEYWMKRKAVLDEVIATPAKVTAR